jgi:ABC-type antimicrobial peptide transport system permease subunit
LILIGFVLAAPMGWIVMNNWLDSFQYKIEMSPFIFALALAVIFIIAIATVGYRSLRAALANPSISLRSE